MARLCRQWRRSPLLRPSSELPLAPWGPLGSFEVAPGQMEWQSVKSWCGERRGEWMRMEGFLPRANEEIFKDVKSVKKVLATSDLAFKTSERGDNTWQYSNSKKRNGFFGSPKSQFKSLYLWPLLTCNARTTCRGVSTCTNAPMDLHGLTFLLFLRQEIGCKALCLHLWIPRRVAFQYHLSVLAETYKSWQRYTTTRGKIYRKNQNILDHQTCSQLQTEDAAISFDAIPCRMLRRDGLNVCFDMLWYALMLWGLVKIVHGPAQIDSDNHDRKSQTCDEEICPLRLQLVLSCVGGPGEWI